MTDPITGSVAGGIASAVASGAVDQIRARLQDSENPEEWWREAARECIIQARVSFQQKYDETSAPDRGGARRDIGRIGKSARELAVRGDIRGYEDEMIDLIERFATACADFAGLPQFGSAKSEGEFRELLNELGTEILERTE